MIEEARFLREPGSGSKDELLGRDETAALGAAMLTRMPVRNELIEDLIDSGEPVGCMPTSDFGPDSDFVPDWSVDSGSDIEPTDGDVF